jgi:hypothetical protein
LFTVKVFSYQRFDVADAAWGGTGALFHLSLPENP